LLPSILPNSRIKATAAGGSDALHYILPVGGAPTLLAMAGTGRCRLYRRDGSPDSERMWHEVEKARYELKGEEIMKFFVPATEGHDDYLMSLALCCHAAQAAAPPAESVAASPRREREMDSVGA
jgi:hypothetical protein